jgi:hypothetical protein
LKVAIKEGMRRNQIKKGWDRFGLMHKERGGKDKMEKWGSIKN